METAVAFVLKQWKWAVCRLPRWLQDDWAGIADVALLRAIRDYRDGPADFRTFLYITCRQTVGSLVAWANYRCRKEPGRGELQDVGVRDPEDGRCDLSVALWRDAMRERAAPLVISRFVHGKVLVGADSTRVSKLIARLRKRHTRDSHG